MIISPGRNYIFVHIPKTGGTSLALALEGRAMKEDILIGDTPKAKKRRKRVQGVASAGRLWKHSTLADIDGLVSREFVEGAFVVTMVRNPWDRVVSYYHWLRGQGFDHPAVHLAKAVGFSAFLNHPETREALRAHPYGSYVTGPEGRERCDLFLRLERFGEDAEPLWAHLGFRLELPRSNASERGAAYRAYYSEADSALVGEICGEDIARFGYGFS
ncbi:MAG: sulfotransferase family 2 domain-containing protein [Roseovarius sp.]